MKELTFFLLFLVSSQMVFATKVNRQASGNVIIEAKTNLRQEFKGQSELTINDNFIRFDFSILGPQEKNELRQNIMVEFIRSGKKCMIKSDGKEDSCTFILSPQGEVQVIEGQVKLNDSINVFNLQIKEKGIGFAVTLYRKNEKIIIVSFQKYI